jgi:hypothetical protein
MLTIDELYDMHAIYWSAVDNLYRRDKGGKSEFGLRTNDIFNDDIYKFPEKYVPARVNTNDTAAKHNIYTAIEGNVCICGCSLCNKLYVMRHIETGKELAVGSSCITKAKGHLFKKYDYYFDEIESIKEEYKKFDEYLKDLDKRRCSKCYDLVYAQNRKPHKKNITKDDYCNTENPPYCYKCDEKYKNRQKCMICDDRIVWGINQCATDKCGINKSYSHKFCEECSKKDLKFGFNIKYDEKDEYKKKYNVKWDTDNKMWYKITTFEKISFLLINKFKAII